MIVIKDGIIEKFIKWADETIYIVTDFDRTITAGNSSSSWGVLSKSHLVPRGYVNERQQLFDFYRPIEVDEKLDFETKNKLMIEWWSKHIGLYIKYKLSENIIIEAAKNLEVMVFREGAKEFLSDMYKRKIPVIIISAGVGNVIEQFLIKNGCNFNNIYIIANFIKFENKIAVGVSNNIIHSLNKNVISLTEDVKKQIFNRSNIILLGDSLSDIKMIAEEKQDEAIKIGFLEENIEENKLLFEKNFDIICTENTSFIKLFETLKEGWIKYN